MRCLAQVPFATSNLLYEVVSVRALLLLQAKKVKTRERKICPPIAAGVENRLSVVLAIVKCLDSAVLSPWQLQL